MAKNNKPESMASEASKKRKRSKKANSVVVTAQPNQKKSSGRSIFAGFATAVLIVLALVLAIGIPATGIALAATGIFSPVGLAIVGVTTLIGVKFAAPAAAVLAANIVLYLFAGPLAGVASILCGGSTIAGCYWLYDKCKHKKPAPPARQASENSELELAPLAADGNLSDDEDEDEQQLPTPTTPTPTTPKQAFVKPPLQRSPGSFNLMNGLVDARRANSPAVVQPPAADKEKKQRRSCGGVSFG